jgi:hypothetical protein
MPHPFKPRRRFSDGRLKYLLTACTFAVITYYYLFRNPAPPAPVLGPKDAASNSTLGVRSLPLVTS